MESQMQNSFSPNSEEKIEIDEEMLIGGVKVNYYIHCKTQLWLFSHLITQEHESEYVILGKILNEVSFQNIKKDILIDNKISVDFIKKNGSVIIHDIKKSPKFKEAHVHQMLYYIYYLKKLKGIEKVEGRIDYPKQRKVVRIELTEEKEREIERILKDIKRIVSLKNPPKPVYKKYCRKCSYFEFCFC